MDKRIIESGRRVFKFTNDHSSDADLMLLVKSGSLSDASNPPGWQCKGISWEYALWPGIGKRAGLCETHQLFITNELMGPTVSKLEDYIALYRDAIAKADPGEELFRQFEIIIDIHAQDNISIDDLHPEYEGDRLKEFLADYRTSAELSTTHISCLIIDFLSLSKAYALSHYNFTVPNKKEPAVIVRLTVTEKKTCFSIPAPSDSDTKQP